MDGALGGLPTDAVRVTRTGDDLVQVECRGVELGWRERTGRHPGTAVEWQGRHWEVTVRVPTRGGVRWLLRPWPDPEAMRDVRLLDVDTVAAAVASARREKRLGRRRLAATLLAPLLGLLPGPVQERWRLEWGYPAGVAVALSALLELALGASGVVQGLLAGFGGPWLLPPWLRWSVLLAPVVLGEGVLRLYRIAVESEVTGSLLLAPLGVGTRGRRPRPERPPVPAERGGRTPEPGLFAVTLKTAYACLARREYQEAWAEKLAVWPGSLTMLGAGAELLGGMVNLARHGGDVPPLLWLDLFFVVEGTVRLMVLAATGRPVGSLLALPLEPLAERRSRGSGSEPG